MEDGFPAVKAKIGLLKPEEDLRRLELARRILGPDRLLMVDANHAYAAHTAARLARAMEPLDVYWFEEPVEPEDMEGYQQVKAGTSIAIAGGECLQTRYGFAPWISSRAIDIVQPDLACVGGLSEGRRIAALATTYHVQCMPHVWGSGVGVAAGLQFLATLCRMPATAAPMAPYNEPMLEWDANPNPLKTAILKSNIELDNGEVQIPSGPGLGVDVELEEVSRYLSKHETVTFS
jgi:D-galactarolactone cycloisomerase